MPIPESIDSHYDLPTEDYFIRSKESGWDQVAHHILDLASLRKDSALRILDVGSGLGNMALAFHRQGHRVTGLEPSSSFFRAASRHDGPEILQSTLQQAEFSDSFDLIVFLAVFEHLTDPIGDFNKAVDLLREGGRICILNVPNAKYAKTRLANFALRCLLRPYVINCSPLHPPFHLWEFQRESLTALGKRFNLEVVHLSVDTSLTFGNPFLYQAYQKLIETTETGEVLRVVFAK